MSLYTVTGATGNIGKELTLKLLAEGHAVRAVGRSAERLQPLVDKGAEAAVGSLEDTAFLATAFTDARAVFAMIPPDPTSGDYRAQQARISGALVSAVRGAGATHAVHLSSFGAHLPSGTGPIAGLHDSEERFNAVEGLNVVHLRPGFFMENLLHNIGPIREHGINGSPLAPYVALPRIATKDIAAVAADYMLAADFTGSSVRDLLGPRDYTMPEVTRALGAAIGKPGLVYLQFTYDEVRNAMLGMGMSASVADLMIEMYTAMNEGTLRRPAQRSEENTTPTTIEEFAQIFAAIYSGGGVAHA